MVKHHTQRFVEDGALFALVGLVGRRLWATFRAIFRLINALPAVGGLMAAAAGQSPPLGVAILSIGGYICMYPLVGKLKLA